METIGRVWQVPIDHPIVPEQGEQPDPFSLMFGIVPKGVGDCGEIVTMNELIEHGADPGELHPPVTTYDGIYVRCTRLPHEDGSHCSHGHDIATIWGGE